MTMNENKTIHFFIVTPVVNSERHNTSIYKQRIYDNINFIHPLSNTITLNSTNQTKHPTYTTI